MPKITVICYITSLILYGLGYSTTWVLRAGSVNTYDYTYYVSMATVYFVLTIFLTIIGTFVYLVRVITIADRKRLRYYTENYNTLRYIGCKVMRDPAGTNEVQERSSRYKYRDGLSRRLSS